VTITSANDEFDLAMAIWLGRDGRGAMFVITVIWILDLAFVGGWQ